MTVLEDPTLMPSALPVTVQSLTVELGPTSMPSLPLALMEQPNTTQLLPTWRPGPPELDSRSRSNWLLYAGAARTPEPSRTPLRIAKFLCGLGTEIAGPEKPG